MADVFISYSRLDQERVQPIADRLSSLGYSVWWDKHERAGRAFIENVDGQLESAQAVLVVWSHNARNSTWVLAEASRGLDARKCVQMRIDAVAPPAPLDCLPLHDLSNERAASWGPLEHALAEIVRNRAAAEPERPARNVGMFATPAASGAPKLFTVATGATLAAYAGALSATQNGVMTPDQLQLALVGMLGVGGVCAALCAFRLFMLTRSGG